MPGPDFKQINADIHNALPPQQDTQTPPFLQALMYGLQAMDAANSAKAFKHGAHEMNPMMQPFSHGGAPTMALGFGLGDLVRHALLKHASQGTRNTADGAQALMNALGIMQTNSRGNLGALADPASPNKPPAPRINLPTNPLHNGPIP